MSRWMTRRPCTYSNARQICTNQLKISSSEKCSFFVSFRLMWYAKSPTNRIHYVVQCYLPSQYSITITSWFDVRKLSLYLTMLGWSRFRRRFTSIMQPSCSFALSPCNMTFFAMYFLPFSLLWLTSIAAPKFPLPMHVSSVYSAA